MLFLSRRACLTGSLATLAMRIAPAAGAESEARRLRTILDTASRDRPAAIAALATIDPTGLPLAGRLDLRTAQAGLAIDAQLADRPAAARNVQNARFPLATLPGGSDQYALLLRRRAGDDIQPDALRSELDRAIEQTLVRADSLFRRLGRRSGSLGMRYSELWHDPQGLYPATETGRAHAVADMNRELARICPLLPTLFGPPPPVVLRVAARRMRAADETAARAGYRELPADGRSGGYYVDLADIRRRPRWTLPPVVHHELLPGHMLQLPLETAVDPHPLRIEYAPAFAEGWAIYAEQLMAAQGVYRGDPLGELGLRHWQLFRLVRARADLGMHLDGWTPTATLSRWRDWMGEPAYFAPFAADLDRILAEPAVRAGEAAVWLAIASLAQGRRPAPFHRALLLAGRARTELFPALLAGTA